METNEVFSLFMNLRPGMSTKRGEGKYMGCILFPHILQTYENIFRLEDKITCFFDSSVIPGKVSFLAVPFLEAVLLC